ncbi:MAG: peroxide stress protein YaaA [Flavobacteriales bacterium]
MIVLLSPAKDLARETPAVDDATRPALLAHAAPLAAKLKGMSAKQLAALMDLSPRLAELNRERFQRWSAPFTPGNARPAIFCFNGEVYRGLEARTLSGADLRFAQAHVRILSGLYGVLRPLDLMQDYRLMMGTPLAVGRFKDLYAYWGHRITDALKADLQASGGDTVVNLASAEYFKAVNPARMGARVVTPVFKDRVGGDYKPLQVYQKFQRGAMARFIIQHRILDAERIKGYESDGYRFAPDMSTEGQWVFVRDRRSPKAAPKKLQGGRVR